MSYRSDYELCDQYILSNPDTAINLIKGMMDIKGESAAGMVVLNQSTKQKVHRFLTGGVKNTLPTECRIFARSLGCVLRLSKNSEGGDVLVCGPMTKDFDTLLTEFCETDDLLERDLIVSFEMPASIRALLHMSENDVVVDTMEMREFIQLTILPDPYRIIFRNRYHPEAEFGILIKPDAKKAMLGVWTMEDEERAKDYRKAVGMQDDEDVFSEIVEENDVWMGWRYSQQYITLTPFDIAKEGNIIAANFEVFRYVYERFVYVLAGVELAQDIKGVKGLIQNKTLTSIREEDEFPANVQDEVLRKREHRCEVNQDHELFEGEDGEPYLRVVPLIPFVPEAVKAYEDKLSSEANAVVLCPMCREKLKHATWNIKENIIMKLYDQRIEKLKEANLDVSRINLLTWYKDGGKTENLKKSLLSCIPGLGEPLAQHGLRGAYPG